MYVQEESASCAGVGTSKPGCPRHCKASCVGPATVCLGSAYILGVIAELLETQCSKGCFRAELAIHGFRVPSPQGLSHWAPESGDLDEFLLPCPAGESAPLHSICMVCFIVWITGSLSLGVQSRPPVCSLVSLWTGAPASTGGLSTKLRIHFLSGLKRRGLPARSP